MKERLSIKPKILGLNDTNDIYMTLNIAILSNDVNYNKAQFLDDFIDGVIENKDFYTGIPFVVNREKLENGEYDNLSHELKDGQLLTDQIGSFVDFWKEEIDGANCLLGSIRVFKRFPKTCNAIIELYNSDDLETSCEVLIDSYQEITEDGVRKIGYNEGKNALIGSCIVTDPAEYRAKATLLVAEAFKEDLKNDKKGENIQVSENQFNKGNDIKFHGQLETSSLKLSDVSNQIYNKLNPIDAKSGDRDYNYWIRDVYTDHAIVEDWRSYEDLYKIPYSIENDEVMIAAKDQWQKGKLGFIPDEVNLDQLQIQVAELNNEIENLKKEEELQMSKTVEELQSELATKDTEIAEFKTKLEDLEKKVTELNETIVSQETSKKELEGQITELNSQIDTLKPFQEKVEAAEKLAKVTEVSNKYSKLLSEETFKLEETQTLINELKVTELNELVVSEIAKQKTEVEVASKGNEDVIITASKQEDLIPKNILQKYGIES